METGSLYAGGRARVTALVTGVPASDLDRPVPSTPNWSVREVVGHLVGLAADAVTPTGGPGGDLGCLSLGAVLDHWAAIGPELEVGLAGAPRAVATRLVSDVACHEHDLRDALHRPGGRTDEIVDFALQAGVGYLDARLRRAGGAGLRLVAGSTEWIVGPGPPAATLRADPFDLFRVVFGRRSRTALAALDWVGDGSAYLDQLPLFDPACAAVAL